MYSAALDLCSRIKPKLSKHTHRFFRQIYIQNCPQMYALALIQFKISCGVRASQLTLSDRNRYVVRRRIPVIIQHTQREHILSLSECGSVRDGLVKADNVRVSGAGETSPGVRYDPVVVVRYGTVERDPRLREGNELQIFYGGNPPACLI